MIFHFSIFLQTRMRLFVISDPVHVLLLIKALRRPAHTILSRVFGAFVSLTSKPHVFICEFDHFMLGTYLLNRDATLVSCSANYPSLYSTWPNYSSMSNSPVLYWKLRISGCFFCIIVFDK